VTWAAPSLNTDGTALTDVSGFRVYYGTSASNLSASADVTGAATRSFLVTGLTAATTYYFAVATKNTTGVLSQPSTPVSQRLP
jgi:hypothetical protein